MVQSFLYGTDVFLLKTVGRKLLVLMFERKDGFAVIERFHT